MYLVGGILATMTLAGTVRVVGKSRAAFGGKLTGERLERVKRSPNHNGRIFENPVATTLGIDSSARDMMRRWLWGKEIRVPRSPLPVHPLSAAELATAPASGLRVTWMGHASALVEIDGARVLTDPVWSKRVSPSPMVGPARFQPAPIALGDLPRLDAVVISHDHYDHLDHATIVALAQTGVRFIVPLGVGAHLERWGIADDRVTELDWWQSAEIAGITVTATPARHFSGRGLGDRNRTLWASFTMRGPRHAVYFGGDSGMFPGFAEIGERHGPFDATLMPIGAYNEAWRAVHMDPEEALEAHRMVGGGVLVPIHWGTFNLAFHDWFEPIERLARAAEGAASPVVMPLAGRPVEPARLPALEPWWRELVGDVERAEPAGPRRAPDARVAARGS